MTTTAAEILTRAGTVLQDTSHVRWTLPELADWLNEAQRSIILADPTANSATVTLNMVEGTLQSLTEEDQLLLLRVPRNLTGASEPFTGGRVVRPTTRETLDGSEPNWHDPNVVSFKAEVRQYIYDEAEPRSFYVYPGNDGTGKVEAVVSLLPTMIDTAGTEISDYEDVEIGLPEPYSVVILDYLLYRAFAKDDIAADMTKAQVHYKAFATALGLKIQVDGANSPNSGARVTRT